MNLYKTIHYILLGQILASNFLQTYGFKNFISSYHSSYEDPAGGGNHSCDTKKRRRLFLCVIVCVSLRYLAGGNYNDIYMLFIFG